MISIVDCVEKAKEKDIVRKIDILLVCWFFLFQLIVHGVLEIG